MRLPKRCGKAPVINSKHKAMACCAGRRLINPTRTHSESKKFIPRFIEKESDPSYLDEEDPKEE